MSYTQLSAEERNFLFSLRSSSDFPLVEIAKLMNRSPVTLSRELRRNTDAHGRYLPDTAHLKMQQRRSGPVPDHWRSKNSF